MAEDVTEKQHEATTKRLEDLRAKGQSLRSRDLTSGLIFVVCVVMLAFMAEQFKEKFTENFILAFTSMNLVAHSVEFPAALMQKFIWTNFFLVLPIFLCVVLTALLSPFLFGGWNFTLQSIQFRLELLNPVSNLQNLFSRRMAMNVVKSILKVLVFLAALLLFCYDRKIQIYDLINLPVQRSILAMYFIAKDYVFVISCSLVFIVVFDVITNYFEYAKKGKMTSQELKDESKETEGNQDVKRKLRSAQFALVRQRLSVTVPRATVIITNPTHYAVAIRYEAGKDKAPKVMAKGKDFSAQQIRRIGVVNSVPIYEAPLLARAIYHTSTVNAEINPGLYMAVAMVLSYVQQLRSYQQGRAAMPQFVSDLKIPDEFVFDE